MENTIENIESWADGVKKHWRFENICLQKGASLDSIFKLEMMVGFAFPLSFKELYQKVDGFHDFDWNEHMIGIWPLNRMEEEYGRDPNFVGFGDFLINSHVYGFLKSEPGIFKNYDLADTVPIKIAETFEEAIELINVNSDLLY